MSVNRNKRLQVCGNFSFLNGSLVSIGVGVLWEHEESIGFSTYKLCVGSSSDSIFHTVMRILLLISYSSLLSPNLFFFSKIFYSNAKVET